jgi:hypothetical protein
MGYETALHLIDVKIKASSAAFVSRTLKTMTGRGLVRLRPFLERAVIDSEGFLAFKASEDGLDPYVAHEEDRTVPALYGKWYEAERFARWLSRHSEKGGRLILHSKEADGRAWGWEFDGRGRMRPLGLVPIGKWE